MVLIAFLVALDALLVLGTILLVVVGRRRSKRRQARPRPVDNAATRPKVVNLAPPPASRRPELPQPARPLKRQPATAAAAAPATSGRRIRGAPRPDHQSTKRRIAATTDAAVARRATRPEP